MSEACKVVRVAFLERSFGEANIVLGTSAIIGFYAWPTKANKTLDKDLQSLPTQTARHVSGRSR